MEFDKELNDESETFEEFEAPKKYKVLLLNDDFTTKEFVVYVLRRIFRKSEEEAYVIMEAVHQSGRGLVGVYAFDVAQSRANMTMNLAHSNGFPLKCILEKE